MQFMKAAIFVFVGAAGGVFGNLLAGFIQNDLWGNTFTTTRLIYTGIGLVISIAVMGWIEGNRQDSNPETTNAGSTSHPIVNANPHVIINNSPQLLSNHVQALAEPLPSNIETNKKPIRVTIARTKKERSYLFRSQIVERMRDEEYSQEAIDAWSLVFNELVNNAFEHGCINIDCTISIQSEVTSSYVTLTISNERMVRFNLEEIIKSQVERLQFNPSERRGRGLIAAFNAADSLTQTSTDDGVKAIIYNERVKLNDIEIYGIRIIQVVSGHGNPSINRRLLDEVLSKQTNTALIIHITGHPGDTSIIHSLLDIFAFYKTLGKKFVVLLSYKNWMIAIQSMKLLPQEMLAYTWAEALSKVGRPELHKRINEMINQQQLIK